MLNKKNIIKSIEPHNPEYIEINYKLSLSDSSLSKLNII